MVAQDEPGSTVQKGPIPARVLLVDDQAEFRSLARTVLEADADFQVVAEAADGEEAVARMDEERPDLVLMDVQMPRLSGLEATRRILARYPRARVVLVSMTDSAELARASQKAGALAFIPKSRFTLAVLRETLAAPS